jgi:hypothetical protein
MLLLLILLSVSLTVSSCASPRVTLYPIETGDIVFVSKGDTFVAPKDGAFLSSKYIDGVLQAKVDKK